MDSGGSINIFILTNLKGFLSLLPFLRAIFGVISEMWRVYGSFFLGAGMGGGSNPQNISYLWKKIKCTKK